MNYNAMLAFFPKLTYTRYKKLTNYFENLEHLWSSELIELVRAGLPTEVAHEFIAWRKNIDIKKIEQTLAADNISTVSIDEPGYPKLLAEINDPPHTLFVRGTLPPSIQPTLAIVGTRACSQYGRQVTADLARELASYGIVIVSGLALGIDGLAHQATLEVGGKTIAVLGSGIDKKSIQPTSHLFLAENIIKNGGAIISQYPPGLKPTAYSFPERNRIIAGLSNGVLITEAPKKSGALITAKLALDYNREVLVVPHPITSEKGFGNNNLIKHGAALITNVKDILEVLSIKIDKERIKDQRPVSDSPEEEKLLEYLSREPISVDALIKETGLNSPAVTSTLTLMELNGKITNLGGMMYVVK